MKLKLYLGILFLLLFTILFSPAVLAEDYEDDDIEVFGLELEKILILFSGILAIILFYLVLAAYIRTKRDRLLYVGAAFFLFGIKGLLIATELVMEEIPQIDLIVAVLDFAILAAFFMGLMKK